MWEYKRTGGVSYVAIEALSGVTRLLPADRIEIRVETDGSGGCRYFAGLACEDNYPPEVDREACLNVLMALLHVAGRDGSREEAEELLQKLERNPKGER